MKVSRSINSTLAALVVGVIVTLSIGSANAEKPAFNKQGHQKIINLLELDETVSESLLKLMQDHRESHMLLKYEEHQEHRRIREQHKDAIKALLGDEKFAEFERLMWMKRNGHGRRKEMRH